jgi:hypothetical protein
MEKLANFGPIRVYPGGKIFSAGTRVSTAELLRIFSRLIRNTPANQFGYKVVALGGPSSVGKTYLAEKLAQHLNKAAVIKMDRWRGSLGKPELTEHEFLQVLGLDQFRADFLTLMERGVLERPPKYVRYHTLEQPREYDEVPLSLAGKEIVIIDGLITLHDQLADLSQLKVAMFAPNDLRYAIRVKRGRVNLPQGPKLNLAGRCSAKADLALFLNYNLETGIYTHIILE